MLLLEVPYPTRNGCQHAELSVVERVVEAGLLSEDHAHHVESLLFPEGAVSPGTIRVVYGFVRCAVTALREIVKVRVAADGLGRSARLLSTPLFLRKRLSARRKRRLRSASASRSSGGDWR
jgi:hypothetical protein